MANSDPWMRHIEHTQEKTNVTITIENLLKTVEEQERTIRDLQGRVCILETAIDRVNRTINERVEQKFDRIGKAITKLQERG